MTYGRRLRTTLKSLNHGYKDNLNEGVSRGLTHLRKGHKVIVVFIRVNEHLGCSINDLFFSLRYILFVCLFVCFFLFSVFLFTNGSSPGEDET